MKSKKIVYGSIVCALVMISIIPLFFSALSVPVITGDDQVSINDLNQSESTIWIDYGVKGFSVRDGRDSLSTMFKPIVRNYIFIKIYLEKETGEPLWGADITVSLKLNTGNTITIRMTTTSNGWASYTYTNTRLWPFKAGTYTATITYITMFPTLGYHWDHDLDTVPLTRSTTI